MSNNTTIITNQTQVVLQTFSMAFCHLVDFPPGGLDCSRNDPLKCVRCRIRGTFFTHESINDYHSVALMYYHFIWTLVLLVSFFGLFGNTLIFAVLKRRPGNNSFDTLLFVLAICDLCASFMSLQVSTASLAFFANYFGRGQVSQYWYALSLFAAVTGRTSSTFITILISIERFLLITFPFRANRWITSRNTKVMICLFILIAFSINYPRFASFSVEENQFRDFPSIGFLDYIIMPTSQGKFSYGRMRALHNQIDFWVPLPLIVTFNLLSLWKVRQLSRRRQEMNLNVKRNIRATKMFLPVVLVYVLTNIGPILNYLLIHFTKTYYREMLQVMFISISFNSAVNLPIYYISSSSFKTEVQTFVGELLKKLGQQERKVKKGLEMREYKGDKFAISNSDSGLPTSLTNAS